MRDRCPFAVAWLSVRIGLRQALRLASSSARLLRACVSGAQYGSVRDFQELKSLAGHQKASPLMRSGLAFRGHWPAANSLSWPVATAEVGFCVWPVSAVEDTMRFRMQQQRLAGRVKFHHLLGQGAVPGCTGFGVISGKSPRERFPRDFQENRKNPVFIAKTRYKIHHNGPLMAMPTYSFTPVIRSFRLLNLPPRVRPNIVAVIRSFEVKCCLSAHFW
jgi:hypothetical protein